MLSNILPQFLLQNFPPYYFPPLKHKCALWSENMVDVETESGEETCTGHMLKFEPRPLPATSASPCEEHKAQRQHPGNAWWRPEGLAGSRATCPCHRHHPGRAHAAGCPPGSAFKDQGAAKDDEHGNFHATSLFGMCDTEQASRPETASPYIMQSNTRAPLRHSNVPGWRH